MVLVTRAGICIENTGEVVRELGFEPRITALEAVALIGLSYPRT